MNLKTKLREKLERIRKARAVNHLRRIELHNYKDPRRIKICEMVELSAAQKKQIDELYGRYYGEKIPYTWHKYYTAFTGRFDVNYFPELLQHPEFQYFMNSKENYKAIYADKNILPLIAAGVGIRMPKTFVSSINGIIRDGNFRLIKKEDLKDILSEKEYFAKPSVDSDSGKGCFLFHPDNDNDFEKIFASGNNFVIQEKIICSKSVAALHPYSVNTFRIMSYIWKNKVELVPVIMRIGRNKSYLDNAHAGGIFIAVNNDGTLHETAFTEFGEAFREHPDTHIVFNGYQIRNFENVLKAAVKMHSAIPQLKMVSWDFTIDYEEKPVLIEANVRHINLWLFQIPWGCGPFGDKTKEILQWLREQKKSLL